MSRNNRSGQDRVRAAFDGRRVLVTGAGGGIGREICLLLERCGSSVIACDRSEEQLSGVPGEHLAFDVTDPAAVDDAFKTAGALDGLVLAHGITALAPLSDVPAESLITVINVNLIGAALCARAALPALKASHGRIGVLSSVSGFAPLIDRTAYSASKHGLHGFFDSLRSELVRDGVSVTIIAPSFVATGIESRAAFRAQGGDGSWSNTGEISQPTDIAREVLVGMAERKRLVLPGRTAKMAWVVSRLSPRQYEATMRRRILKSARS